MNRYKLTAEFDSDMLDDELLDELCEFVDDCEAVEPWEDAQLDVKVIKEHPADLEYYDDDEEA